MSLEWARQLQGPALSGGLGQAPSKCLRNVCETEWNKLKNAGYLFLWQRNQLPSEGLLQTNYFRTWPVSSNEASPPVQLCS